MCCYAGTIHCSEQAICIRVDKLLKTSCDAACHLQYDLLEGH